MPQIEEILEMVQKAKEEDPILARMLEQFRIDSVEYAEALAQLMALQTRVISCAATTSP